MAASPRRDSALHGAPDAPPGLDTPLQYLKGVGPQRARHLARLGLETVGDALLYLPSRHEDRSRLTPLGRVKERRNVP